MIRGKITPESLWGFRARRQVVDMDDLGISRRISSYVVSTHPWMKNMRKSNWTISPSKVGMNIKHILGKLL